MVHRKRTSKALATELVRQVRRHNVAGAEHERLCRWGLRRPTAVASVVKLLTALILLESPAVDRSLEVDAHVPSETLALARLSRVAPEKALAEAWREYVTGECGKRGDRGDTARPGPTGAPTTR